LVPTFEENKELIKRELLIAIDVDSHQQDRACLHDLFGRAGVSVRITNVENPVDNYTDLKKINKISG
jgi:hypothetical protein